MPRTSNNMTELEYSVDGVLVVLSSNPLNLATSVHQMGDVCLPSGEQKWQYVFDLN